MSTNHKSRLHIPSFQGKGRACTASPMSVTKVALAAAAGGGRSRGGPNVRGPSDAPLSWKIFPAERDTYPARTAAASPSQNTHSRRFTHTLTHTLSTHTLTHTLSTHTLILTHTSINCAPHRLRGRSPQGGRRDEEITKEEEEEEEKKERQGLERRTENGENKMTVPQRRRSSRCRANPPPPSRPHPPRGGKACPPS